MRIAAALILLAACADQGPEDITGPFTGPTHRFVVDKIELPMTNTEARTFGDDLSGDGTVDNQLGQVISTLGSMGDITTHGADMIAAGSIASSFEIVANDLVNDSTVSVLYRGADGEKATAVGGELVDGHFRSNRTTTTKVPGDVRAHLPVFLDADPVLLDIGGLEIDLAPDGHGGYDGLVRGVVDVDDALNASWLPAMQMIEASPNAHMAFIRTLDTPPLDWIVTITEFTTNDLVVALFTPDVRYRAYMRLSIGYRVHLSPCAAGRCATSAPADSCHDRVTDGDETDVDCGGSCDACPGSRHCGDASDCQSNKCDSGMCDSPSCTDHVRDGFETDVDCGSQCGACGVGQQCYADVDCGMGHTCGAPCNDSSCDGYDHCR